MRLFPAVAIALLFPVTLLLTADAPPGVPPKGPRSPREEQATFQLSPGFAIHLAAREPDVVDPVSLAFDGDGRLFVAEMRGYPNKGVGTGTITSGRIKLLEDADNDGVFEKATLYADNLRLPMGLLPYKNGLIVCAAPDILFLEDADGDGQAERRRVLYTGFGLSNIQQMINTPRWALDNWVHAVAGNSGGAVRSGEKEAPPVELRGRGVRFQPDVPASLEPTSGGVQYGLTQDLWQHWFSATNSQHLRQIVLPDHYLRRNPALAVPAVTIDIPDHGAACKVHRISPFESWRVERTTRRAKGPDAGRFSSTELVPGGFITSACSPVIYLADQFPEAYRGNVFVCDPANNLIHRDLLVPNGAAFIARRADADREFLASTDNWFRPVSLAVGPDGDLYVLDFYREVIETPLSLPDDIKEKLNLESRGRGRIWRITAKGDRDRPAKPALAKAPATELVKALAHPNRWWRITAQQKLVERQDRSAVKELADLARARKGEPARAHALWTLHGLGALTEELIALALADPEPGVREQGLRLAEERLEKSEALRAAVGKMTDDPDPRVRFQLAFTLGEAPPAEAVDALARLALRDGGDRWIQTALLSSAGACAPELLRTLARDPKFPTNAGRLALLGRLAFIVGARADDADLAKALGLLAAKAPEPVLVALLDGLGQGLKNRARPLPDLWEKPPASLQDAVRIARGLFDEAAEKALDAKRPEADRLASIKLLGQGPYEPAGRALPPLLTPRTPPALQLAAVRALAQHDREGVAELLLKEWAGYSPVVRREVLEGLFARRGRLDHLLDALEKKDVLAVQIEPARLEQLRKHRDPAVRKRAASLLAGQAAPDRVKVVREYEAVLEMEGDAARGKMLFTKHCATCHRLQDVGTEVGPDLAAALRNKSREQLLIDVLDPSREVDPRYLNYLVETKKGRALTGMIAAETASSLTLRRGEKEEDVILRDQVESIAATGKSVMPEGLEMQLKPQDLADVIAYLLSAAAPK